MPTVITPEDVKSRYPNIGCSDADIADFIEIVDGKDDCLDLNYSEAVIRQIKLSYVAIMCSSTSGGQKLIKSQRAPSGASQSFEYSKDTGLNLKNKLESLDTAGCVTPLLPGSTFTVRASGRRCRP